VGEVNLRIVHCLIAHPGVGLGEIRRVYSHPQALAQCEGYLDRLPGVERVPSYDTAGSVKLILEQGIRDGAAIASGQAARVYHMAVLADGIEDDPENYTRFLVLAREEIAPDGPAKTSIVYSVSHAPGSLFKSLSVFALRDINLTKIESRPQRGKPWEYIFYLDFEGNRTEERCKNALNHLREYATFLRILGSYPKAERLDEAARP
jgi:prephenate dehydratase